jgi:iron complex outermembrane receptor protein
MSHNSKLWLYVAAQGAIGLSNVSVAADNLAGPAVAPVEEIVVTARKREERLIEVPDSVTTLSARAIESAGVANVKDVARFVPNLSIVEAQQPGVSFITIRGVGQVRNGEAPVAVIIDGVQLFSANQITQDLFDIERIEVLRGPQGAVYGRNAIGGAINIVTRQPTNELEGRVQLGYGSGDSFTGEAVLSGPIVEDRLLFRIAGAYKDFDGDIDSALYNTPVNGEKTKNVRLGLLAQLNDATTLDLRASRLDTDSGAAWYTLVPPGTSINEPLPVTEDHIGHADRELTDFSAKLDIDLSFATLTSISAYSKVQSGIDEDFDFLPADLLTARQTLDTDAWSQELRLTSSDSGSFKWLVGAYYLDMQQRLDSELYLHPGASFVLAPFPIPAPMLFSATRATNDNQAYALFGQISQRFAGNWEWSLGLRQDWDEREQLDRVTNGVVSKTFESLQPKLQLSYFPSRDATIYFSAGKGFRSGGFNPNDRITRIFDAEENWSYEIGGKARLFDGRLDISSSAFLTRIDDRQVYSFDLFTAAQIIANPIPKAEIRGVEVETLWRPIGGLELSASLGLLDTEIKKYDTSVYASLPAAGDYTGNKLPMTAHVSYSLGAQYSFAVATDWDLILRSDFSSAGGDYYWEVDNADERKTLDLVSLRASLAHDGFTITGFVDNAGDEPYVLEYISQRFSGAPIGNYSMPAPGRRWGAKLAYRF